MSTHQNVQPVTQRFRLDTQSTDELRKLTPQFGFNGLGELVFRRTYSRDNESWADVVIRVVEGCMSIRKEHFYRNSLRWVDSEWQSFAREMALSLFNMEWLPPGRGLWMMGTDFTYQRGSMALYNCAATDSAEDLVLSAEWTMDCLMNGVGVGFSTYWRGTATAPDKSDSELFVIPDSREGWVASLIRLMCAYVNSPRYGKNKFPVFDYSQIRSAGEPIRGFGGTASGPAPLKQLHERVESYLDAFCAGRLQCRSKTWKEFKSEGKPSEWREVEVDVDKPYQHTRLIADVFNAIGACVVAGNVRRCLPGDAMVHTRTGLVPIKDVQVGCDVLTSHGYQKVLTKFIQGVQKLVKVITQDGYFRCTVDHKIAVCTGYESYEWKKAGELCSGDRLLSPRTAIDGQKTRLPKYFTEGNEVPVLDADLAWLLGFLQADTDNDDSVDPPIRTYFKRYDIAKKIHDQLQCFDKNLDTGIGRWLCKLYAVGFNSEQLVGYLDKYSRSHSKVPEYILSAEKDVRLAYIAGICDSIGCLANRYIRVASSTCEQFVHDIQKVLYSCGIESRLSLQDEEYQVILVTQRSRQLFANIPELMSEVKTPTAFYAPNGFPSDFETNPKIRATHNLRIARQFNIDSYDSVHGECAYTPVEVLQVADDMSEETFDIEVENYHEFFCDGYLVSNSAQISLGDVYDDEFVNLKNYELHPERSAIGWMSNNSVVLKADKGYEDFSYIPDIARRIRDNGEPGVINLYNIQKYGRYGKESPDPATLVNPCSEITLCSMETCNLAEIFPPRCANPNRFYKALEYATFYASTVSLLPTHRSETNAIVARNRRIGISISGIAQWASGAVPAEWGMMNYTRMSTFLRAAYKIVKQTNTELAKVAGVLPSIRVTTVKPSGSISLLAGCTPGVHYPVSRYAIRRVRIGKLSPIVPALVEAGVPHEDDKVSENTYVFEFVIDHGDVRSAEQVSPWEQFSIVQMLQRHYADNCVSATIYFDKEKDGPDVEKMLAMFIPSLKSVSMLPHSGHGYAQAPYEPISKEEYERRLAAFHYPVYDQVRGNVPVGSKFCTNDHCEL
jgi:hypothetical protein